MKTRARLLGRLFWSGTLVLGAAALLVVVILVWRNPVQVQTLTLNGRPVTVRLTKRPHQKHIHTLRVRVEGRATGRLVVRRGTVLGPAADRVDTVGASFRLEYDSDWYQPDCYLHFEPLVGAGGPVRISYKFLDI